MMAPKDKVPCKNRVVNKIEVPQPGIKPTRAAKMGCQRLSDNSSAPMRSAPNRLVIRLIISMVRNK